MYVQTRYYRSPCVILGIPYDCGVDMWSLGCVLAELHMGRPLFPGDNDVDQLARIMEILGPPPMHVVERSQKRNIFFEGETNRPRIVPNLHGKRRRPGTRSLKNLVQTKDEVFLSFLEGCLCWDPNKRLTPETAVNHEFVANLKKPG
jgi:dual specificity tyrosine-phosphorylation-regulated kinase 2/3/4